MFGYLKQIGIDKADTSELRQRKASLLLIILYCCIAAIICSGSYYLAGLSSAGLIPLMYLLVISPAVVVFSINKNERILLNIQLMAVFICPVAMQWMAGGYLKGGIVILWSFLSPLTALIFHDIKKARLYAVLVIASLLFTAVFNNYLGQWGSYPDRSQKIIQLTFNLTGIVLMLFFAVLHLVKAINKNDRLLVTERQRADRLLLNILPAQIAEELKASGKTEPTLYTDATIIFTDFKDFTQFSELFTPEELIGELEECFNSFDEIITSHGLEKIKTIGDAYMCVAGIPKNDGDGLTNAIHAIMAGLEIAELIETIRARKYKEGKAYWNIRIGAHTGDVVGGIVGKRKFVFDIWGDAVNTANRLETCSEEGKLNISGTTYELVKDFFNCTYRGKLAVKNKGELEMYFVESANHDAIDAYMAEKRYLHQYA